MLLLLESWKCAIGTVTLMRTKSTPRADVVGIPSMRVVVGMRTAKPTGTMNANYFEKYLRLALDNADK